MNNGDRDCPRKREAVEAVCPLCLKARALVHSHILPAGIAKWHTRTSPTGYLMSPTAGDLRPQTYLKVPLLCASCDNSFAAAEGWFQQRFFHQIHERADEKVDYGPSLMRFVVFTCWKIVQLHRKASPDWTGPFLKKAASVWREYLMGHRVDCGRYEFYVMPLANLADVLLRMGIPAAQMLASRIASAGVGTHNQAIAIHFMLPGVLVVGAIKPKHFRGLESFQVRSTGSIPLDQPPRTLDVLGLVLPVLADLYFYRANESKDRKEIVKDRIRKSFARNPRAYSKSDGFRAFVRDIVDTYYNELGVEPPEHSWLDRHAIAPTTVPKELCETLMSRWKEIVNDLKPGRQWGLEEVFVQVCKEKLGGFSVQVVAPYTRDVRVALERYAPGGHRFIVGFEGATDTEIVFSICLVKVEDIKCDLCGSASPQSTRLVVPDFSFPSPFGFPWHNQDDYMACDACYQDVQTIDTLHRIVERNLERMENSGAFSELPEEAQEPARLLMQDHLALHVGLVYHLRVT